MAREKSGKRKAKKTPASTKRKREESQAAQGSVPLSESDDHTEHEQHPVAVPVSTTGTIDEDAPQILQSVKFTLTVNV